MNTTTPERTSAAGSDAQAKLSVGQAKLQSLLNSLNLNARRARQSRRPHTGQLK